MTTSPAGVSSAPLESILEQMEQVHVPNGLHEDNGEDSGHEEAYPPSSPFLHSGKRSSRACIACRKGKNKCEGGDSGDNPPCDRCKKYKLECIFDKAPRQSAADVMAVKVGSFQSQILDLKTTVQGQDAKLDAILRHLGVSQMSPTIPLPSTSSGNAKTDIAVDPSLAEPGSLKRPVPTAFDTPSPKRPRGIDNENYNRLRRLLMEMRGADPGVWLHTLLRDNAVAFDILQAFVLTKDGTDFSKAQDLLLSTVQSLSTGV